MNENSAQQPNLEQDEHDKRMREMSSEKRKAMVKGLGELARSKAGNVSSSTENDSGEPRRRSA